MRFTALAFILAAAACTGPSAYVTDLEDDKVVVRTEMGDVNTAYPEAQAACSLHGKTPRPVSWQCASRYCTVKRFLFACVE